MYKEKGKERKGKIAFNQKEYLPFYQKDILPFTKGDLFLLPKGIYVERKRKYKRKARKGKDRKNSLQREDIFRDVKEGLLKKEY